MGMVPPPLIQPRRSEEPQRRNLRLEDYEQPRTEYPFPPEPDEDENAPLWEVKDGVFIEHKRATVKRLIDGGVKWCHFLHKSVENLAWEVGLWEYYQSRQERHNAN